MDLGRLLLRCTVGGTFFVHGTQKLFGWFGGGGLDQAAEEFESFGLRPGRRNAYAAGSTEVGCGILLALGLAAALTAAGVSGVMITALRTATWKDGFKPTTGQHQVLLAVAALALVETGPGTPSLDATLGLERTGEAWMLAALGAGAVGSAAVIALGRREPAGLRRPTSADAPSAEPPPSHARRLGDGRRQREAQ